MLLGLGNYDVAFNLCGLLGLRLWAFVSVRFVYGVLARFGGCLKSVGCCF